MIAADPYLLDDAEALEQADASGAVRAAAAAPASVRAAAYGALEVDLADLRDLVRPRALVVLSDGDDVAAGELLAALVAPRASVPVVVGDELPAWVGAADVVVALSPASSGSALLAAADAAVRRGAATVGIAPERSPLEAVVRSGRGTVLPVALPAAAGADLWSLAVPLLVVADALGIGRVTTAELDALAEVLEASTERCKAAKESFLNPAKELALAVVERQPSVWGATPVAGVAARRMARLLSSRAGVAAVAASLPTDADLSGILDGPDAADGAVVVLMRDDATPSGAGAANALRDAAAGRGIPVHELAPEGASTLERTASLLALGEFVAAYAALVRGLDPARTAAAAEVAAAAGRQPRGPR